MPSKMLKRMIMIVGPIGTFSTQDGEEINGMQLLDLITQVNSQLDENTKELHFEFESGGGQDRVGMAMYDYLQSLKSKGVKLIGHQIGMIASTATRPWLAMDERIALDDGSKNFFIHNPWLPPGRVGGDANNIQAAADAMRAKEDSFREFYSQHTGVSVEGLKPLMDDQTGFGADQAIALKFATSKTKSYNLAAYKMKKKNKVLTLLDELVAAFKSGATDDDVVALVIELEGGQKVSAPIEDTSKLVKGTQVFTVDEQGNETQVPVADGDYVTSDGLTFTVASGVLAADAAPKATEEPPVGGDNSEQAITAALAEVVKVVKAQGKPMTKEDIKAIIQEELVEFKKTVKTTFVPPNPKSGNSAEDVAEWERSFKANEHADMKKNDPDKYARLFHAKYGRVPN